jgi:hypothetical protein
MKTKTKLNYIQEVPRYLCLAAVFVLGLVSIVATGGGGSSGSSSENTLVSEARVTVLSNATPTPIQGAQVRGVTDATGKCVVTVTMPGQLADEVTLTVSQADFYAAKDEETLDSTGSVNAIVYMTPR